MFIPLRLLQNDARLVFLLDSLYIKDFVIHFLPDVLPGLPISSPFPPPHPLHH
jgi:hypothetical protein